MNVNSIGQIDCPVCGDPVEVKITKKTKPYLTCGGCGCQVFTRSARSGQILIDRIKNKASGTIETAEPIPEARSEHKNEPIEAPAVTVRTHTADGVTITQQKQIKPEKTIFDIFS